MKQFLDLKLGGKSRRFTFGVVFIGEVLEDLDLDFNELITKMTKNTFKYVPVLMYHSLVNSYLKDNKELDFGKQDVNNWIDSEDNLGVDKILSFVNAFIASTNNSISEDNLSESESESKKK